MGKDYKHYEDEYKDLERFFAMTWGTPTSIAILLLSLCACLISIGIFIWLLHLANIIK